MPEVWTNITKNGRIQNVKNLAKFARSKGIAPQHLNRVANGKRPAYKGITIRREA